MSPEKMFECVMDLKDIFNTLKEGKVEIYFYENHIEFCKDEFCLEYYFINRGDE